MGDRNGLLVAPARPQVPGSPTLLPQRPAHAPGPLFRSLSGLGPRPLRPGRRAKGRTRSVGSRRGRRGLSEPRPKLGIRPSRPSPRRPEWGRGPTHRPDPPTTRSLREPLPSEWSSLNIHFMVVAGKGCSRLSEPRSSANQPQQQRRQRRRRRRRLHDRRDFRLPEPSNRPGAGLPAPFAGPRAGGGAKVKGRGRRPLQQGLPRRSGADDVHYRAVFEGFGDCKGMFSGAGNRSGGSVDVGNRKRSLGVWLIG